MRAERGAALLLALVVLIMGSLYVILASVNETYARIELEREDRSEAALRQAKEALIARAALDANRPGSLPCPDTNNDGVAELLAGNACPSYLGRLPWRTLGLPDLRDGAGERLWYVLSTAFTDSTTSVINSDTQGTLRLVGDATARNLVAIVFSPGPALCGQQRNAANANNAANYLERENRNASNADYTAAGASTSGDCAAVGTAAQPFNDRALGITHAEFFDVVENAVAHRLETEVKPILFERRTTSGALVTSYAQKGHFQRWRENAGASNQQYFPFAAAFANPGASNFQGTPNELTGLAPVVDPQDAFVSFDIADASRDLYGSPDLLAETTPCQLAADARVVFCRYRYVRGTSPYVGLRAYARNAALAFVNPVQPSEVKTCVEDLGTVCSLDSGSFAAGAGWSPAWTSVSNQIVTSGFSAPIWSDRITASVLLPARDPSPPSPAPPQPGVDSETNYLYIGVPVPEYNQELASSWFFRNGWHRVTMYAISAGYAPGGVRACDPPTSGAPICINVEGYRGISPSAPPAPDHDNKYVALVLAGRALAGQGTRPSGVIANYLEGANNAWFPGTPAFAFESFLRSTTRNDKVAVIAP